MVRAMKEIYEKYLETYSDGLQQNVEMSTGWRLLPMWKAELIRIVERDGYTL